MNEINLLPRRLRCESGAGRRLAWLAGICGACLLAALFFYGRWRVGVLESELEALRLDRSLLEPTAARMAESEALSSVTARREAALERLSRASLSPYAVLVQLGAAADGVRLTEVVVAVDGATVVRGRAPSYPAAAAFAERLAQRGLFAQPVLADSQQERAAESVRFEIRMRCRGAAT